MGGKKRGRGGGEKQFRGEKSQRPANPSTEDPAIRAGRKTATIAAEIMRASGAEKNRRCGGGQESLERPSQAPSCPFSYTRASCGGSKGDEKNERAECLVRLGRGKGYSQILDGKTLHVW